MALAVGSIFYNLPNTTDALYGRGAFPFFGILLAAFASALEVWPLSRYHKQSLHVVDHGSLCATTHR